MPKKTIMWIFHDSKPGHLSQLEGLINRLCAHQCFDIQWFDITQHKLHLLNIFYIPRFFKQQAKPDLIIGAGHRTHLSVLIAGMKHKAFTTIVMKPSLPWRFFDAVICPKHDGLADSKTVLTTLGSINKVTPANACATPLNRNKHLMLIGGPSKHFVFDDAKLINAIKQICNKDIDTSWQLSDSPRTPDSFMSALKKLALPNLKLFSYADKHFGELDTVLKQSAFTWVTPDSMSMLYESLTSGSITGVFDMPVSNKKKPSRIAKHIQQLSNEGTVLNYQSWHRRNNHTTMTEAPPPPSTTFWEAERAALWLLHRLKETNNT